MPEEKLLTIVSPAHSQKELFRWKYGKGGEIGDENFEAVEIIGWLIKDVDKLSDDEKLLSAFDSVDRSSYTSVSNLCGIYNTVITQKLKECYNRAVAEPDKLNQYQPFSPQVYGETSFELISQMIDTVNVTAEDTFIDLGSEKADYPAYCASNLDKQFRHWMAFYGKSYRPYLLERGDFLSRECHDRIMSASVLFANNFAFGPEVDHQLKQKFANLREGARIISSKAFCPLNFRITDRNLGDIGSIMHVHCLNPLHDAVSWTDKPFSYYVHTIDRSLLERYFSRLKNPTVKDDLDAVRRDRKGRIISDQNLKELPHVTNGLNQSRKATTHAVCQQQPQTAGRSRRSRSLSSGLRANNSSGLLPRRTNGMRHVRSTTDTANIQATSNGAATFRQRRNAPSNRPAYGCKPSRRSNQHKVSAASRSPPAPTTDYLAPSSQLPLHLTSLSVEQPGAAVGARVGCTHSAPATFPTGHVSSGRTSPSGSTPDDEDTEGLGKHRLPCQLPGYRRTVTSRAVPPWSSSYSSSTSSSSSCLVASLASSRVTRSPADSVAAGAGANSHHHQSDEQASGSSDVCPSSQEGADSLRLTLRLSTDEYQVVASTNGDCDDGDEAEDTSVANRRAVRKCRQSSTQESSQTDPISRLHRLSGAARLRRRASARRAGDPASRKRSKQTHVRRPLLDSAVNLSAGRGHNLNRLHEETVAQIGKRPTGVRQELSSEAGRNNCPSVASFTCHYNPVELRSVEAMRQHAQLTSGDPNIGHSQQPVPLALTQYLELTKRVLLDQFTAMRSLGYVEKVNAQLARERLRKTELLSRLGQLENSISSLHTNGTELLQTFMKQARKLIKHHHMLESKISRYREEISQLTSANQELVRGHQDEATRLISTVTSQVSSPADSQMPIASDLPPPMLIEETVRIPALHPDVAPLNRCPTTPPHLPGGHNAIPPPPQLTKVTTCSSSQFSFGNGSLGSIPSGLPQSFVKTPHMLPVSSCKQPAIRPLLIIDRSASSCASTTTPPTAAAAVESSTASPFDQTGLPPPPPLLPMHHRQPDVQSPSVTTSSIGVSPRFTDKSMHASLQDLISDELNRPTADREPAPPMLCLATLPQHVSSTAAAASFLSQPDSLHHQQLSSVKATGGNSAMQQFMLPPRKRQWDFPADRSPPPSHSHKLARRSAHHRRLSTPVSCTTSVPGLLGRAGQDYFSSSSSNNLSPPPLSPGELGLPTSVSPTSSCSSSSSQWSGLKMQPFFYPPASRCTNTTNSIGSSSSSSSQYSEPVTSRLLSHSPTTPMLSQTSSGDGSSSGDQVPTTHHQRHLKDTLSRDTPPPPLLSKAVAYASQQTMVP